MASNNEEDKIALAAEGATPAADIDPSLVTTGSPVEGGCVYTSFKANPTLPTDATTKISTLADLVSLGDLSPDGFTASKSVTVNEFKGWHQSIVLTKVSEEKHQYKMVFIESVRSSVAKLRYGADNVETNEDGTFIHIKAVANTYMLEPLLIDGLDDTEGIGDGRLAHPHGITGLHCPRGLHLSPVDGDAPVFAGIGSKRPRLVDACRPQPFVDSGFCLCHIL